MSDAGFQDMSQALQPLTSLKTINLDFSGCPGLTDLSLEGVSQAIQTFGSLKNMDISFQG